jgi:hypothetical protein
MEALEQRTIRHDIQYNLERAHDYLDDGQVEEAREILFYLPRNIGDLEESRDALAFGVAIYDSFETGELAPFLQ